MAIHQLALVIIVMVVLWMPPGHRGVSLAATPGGKPAEGTDWEKTLAAAKQEGTLVLAGVTGALFREALLTEFQRAYPDIRVEYSGIGGRDFAPRILAERRAGQYLWDLNIGGAGTMALNLKPSGALEPIKPALILPEVTDDKKWLGGFDEGWYDKEKRYIFAFQASLHHQVYVNRDVIPESQLDRIEDLLKPQWKGKIASDEIRGYGSGCGVGAHFILALGEEFLSKLYAQDVVLTQDRRQLVEWLVRGRYPIAIGIRPVELENFQSQGLGKNVKPLAPESDAGVRISQGSGAVVLISRAPHPNASKVYLNWLLSRAGQVAWTKITKENSRRLDVTEGDPKARPDPKKRYYGDVAKEENLYLPDRCIEIGKKLFR